MAQASEAHDGRDLVRQIGSGEVANLLGEAPSTVSNWLRRGVPAAKRLAVAEIAKGKGVAIPLGFLPVKRQRRPILSRRA